MDADRVALDTNVLIAASNPMRPWHAEALRMLAQWPQDGIALYASTQILREYLSVATRPVAANGLGLLRTAAVANVREFRRRIELLADTEAVSARLLELLEAVECTGRQVHDANIVATMLVHGVGTLVTDDRSHFERFAHLIEVRDLAG
ncbi:MAG: type II toxin-antitoxin system VapC family toxin [Sporichthyaceae bacterium]